MLIRTAIRHLLVFLHVSKNRATLKLLFSQNDGRQNNGRTGQIILPFIILQTLLIFGCALGSLW